MATPWRTLDSAPSEFGTLELRQRGADDFLITIDGRILMTSRASASETALAELACEGLTDRAAPRILIGGLGMGLTLRAALDLLPAGAEVRVSELSPTIVGWCRGPLAALTETAVDDRRVRIEIEDVILEIDRAAAAEGASRYDAIALDLFEGPGASRRGGELAIYEGPALERAHRALRKSGTLAVWSEQADPRFEERLAATGFEVQKYLRGRGGRRHIVYVARS